MPDRGQHHAGAASYPTGLLIATIGGILLTLDVPLLRLAAADSWSATFVRGLFMFVAISAGWWWFMRRHDPTMPFINGRVGLFVAFTSMLASMMFIFAVHHTKAANLVFILALNPLFCALMAWIIFAERLPWQTWAAIVVAIGGVAIIVGDGVANNTLFGDLLAIGVALCIAIAITAIRRTGRNLVTSLAAGSLLSALVASFFAAPLAMSAESWMWLALNGLIIVPLATALSALAPRYIPAPEAAMFFLLEAVLVPVWIYLIFKEAPTTNAMIGGSIVVATLVGHSLWRLYASPDGSASGRRWPVGSPAE
jgi:drug/metabolite transporter (DMT)-like permease